MFSIIANNLIDVETSSSGPKRPQAEFIFYVRNIKLQAFVIINANHSINRRPNDESESLSKLSGKLETTKTTTTGAQNNYKSPIPQRW
ncbi:hypothetical protein DERP_011345 [Dermatophagoides pteronyssinus]|uniref:Uncharacterized protein n=1 Tax=Dermatophagoides pteronyssinus TaxID=6956 RepID=A0ABQ8J7D4_DERPT|nr:hypothetical protein DERP_011345 [Dermatophagoides pteronyssinus]